MIRRAIPLSLLFLALSACGQPDGDGADVRRFTRTQTRGNTDAVLASPDTSKAGWTVSENGQSIAYGDAGAEPFLTLSCALRSTPVQLQIVRHVAARPGQQAMFPVIGNGAISRFKLDAALVEGRWRWAGAVAATDPQLAVFSGPRELEATLPGGGSLLVGPSRIPAEFVRWCRAGGAMQRAQRVEQATQALDSSAER